MKRKLYHILLAAMLCCGILIGCGGKETDKKEDVTLIVKVLALMMNSVSKPDILDAAIFLQQAGDAFAKQYEEAKITIHPHSH